MGATAGCPASLRSEFGYRGNRFRSETEGAHWPGDVLDLLLAEILKGDRQLIADLVADGAGDAQPAGPAQVLQPGGDIDAVAEDVAVFADDVPDIDADAKDEPLVLRHVRVSGRHPLLNRDSASDGFNGAREFNEKTVTSSLDDATVVGGDLRVDQLSPVPLQGAQGTDLVGTHQPTVADDICRHDRGEPAFDRLSGFHRFTAGSRRRRRPVVNSPALSEHRTCASCCTQAFSNPHKATSLLPRPATSMRSRSSTCGI